MKYVACIQATFEIEFEDNEDLNLPDQAWDAFIAWLPDEDCLLDGTVLTVDGMEQK